MTKHILWVEDEKDQYRAFSYKLTPNYQLTRAIDYQSAIDLFAKSDFDMVIVDIILPSGFSQKKLNSLENVTDIYFGIEFIIHIRSSNKDIPIVVVSIVTEKEKVERIKNIDPDIKFISKYDSTSDDVKELTEKIFNQE